MIENPKSMRRVPKHSIELGARRPSMRPSPDKDGDEGIWDRERFDDPGNEQVVWYGTGVISNRNDDPSGSLALPREREHGGSELTQWGALEGRMCCALEILVWHPQRGGILREEDGGLEQSGVPLQCVVGRAVG